MKMKNIFKINRRNTATESAGISAGAYSNLSLDKERKSTLSSLRNKMRSLTRKNLSIDREIVLFEKKKRREQPRLERHELSLKKQIEFIRQGGTQASLPFFKKPHQFLLAKFQWYRNWNNNPNASMIHLATAASTGFVVVVILATLIQLTPFSMAVATKSADKTSQVATITVPGATKQMSSAANAVASISNDKISVDFSDKNTKSASATIRTAVKNGAEKSVEFTVLQPSSTENSVSDISRSSWIEKARAEEISEAKDPKESIEATAEKVDKSDPNQVKMTVNSSLDLKYELKQEKNNNQVKETLIIKDKSALTLSPDYHVDFKLNLQGLKVAQAADGSYVLINDDGSGAVMSIMPPVIEDANKKSGPVSLLIEGDTATYSIDKAYADSAVYPLYLDPTVTIATSTTTNPNSFSKDRTLFEATNGDMINVYSAGAELDYKISTDHGNTWGAASKIIDSSTTDDTGFSGWITADNKIHLVYSNNNTNSYIFYRQLTYATSSHTITSLGTEYTVESAGSSQGFPTVAQKSDGTIYVAYQYYDASNYTIKVKASTATDGSTWAASTTLSAATNASANTYPALTLWNDNPAVIYNFANASIRWNYYSSGWQAAGWTNETIASDVGAALNQEFSISQTTSDNYMHLAWKDDSVGIKYRKNANAAGSWDGASTAITTGASHASDKNPSIGLGLNDAIYLYYSEYVGVNSYNIKYQEKMGSAGTFGAPITVTTDNGNNLIAQAALKPTLALATNQPNYALLYSANGSYVGGASSPSINGSFTISAWVNRSGNQTVSTNSTIVDIGTQPGNTGFGMWISANSQIGWRINNDYNHYQAGNVPTNGNWEHYVIVYNGATVKTYKNAGTPTSDNYTTNPTAVTNYTRVGCRESGNGCFNGKIDEMQIYDRALSAGEVTTLYNSGTIRSAILENNLRSAYRFDENTGTTTADYTGNGYNLSMTGTPGWVASLNQTIYYSSQGKNAYSPAVFVSGTGSPYSLNYAPTVKTWSAAADGNWETAGNWTPSGAPAAGDTVIFDATSIKNCTVTTFTSGNGIADGIGSISLSAGYTGTLNFQKKPSQNTDPYKINITGDFTINAGTVTTDGDTTVAGGRGNEFDASNMRIASGASFNADGKGFTAFSGPGSGSGTGGSYGGEGNGASVSKVYGDYSNPVSLGSGSGSAGGGAIVLNVTNTLDIMGTISANSAATGNSAGSGGSVNLTAATISNFGGGGSITANGGNGDGGSSSSGGGGGRVKLGATTISYSGTLLGIGGHYSNSSGSVGSAGTVFKKTAAQTYGDLIINNTGNTPDLTNQYAAHLKTSADTGSYQFDSITCSNYGRLAIDASQSLALDSGSITGDKNSGFINAGTVTTPASWTMGYMFSDKSGTITGLSSKTITVSSTGRLTNYPNPAGASEVYKLNWTVSALTVQLSGEINVNGVGFAAFNGPGYTAGKGSSYGGEGYQSTPSKVYGDYSNPTSLGSGSGGAGGGAIILNVTNTLDIMGIISANGGPTGNSAGSGGSVNLTAATISNSGGGGSITANGGNGGGGSTSGSGGGGRVKLGATTISYSGTFLAGGGAYVSSNYVGTAGTVFKKTTAQSYGDLIIDDGTYTPAIYVQAAAHLKTSTDAGTYQFDSITCRNYGRLAIDASQTLALDSGSITGNKNSGFIVAGTVTTPQTWTIGYYFSTENATIPSLSAKDITISSTGLLTHYPNPAGASEVYKLNWTINSLNVQAIGEINVAGVGFAAGYGTGYDGGGAAYGGESSAATAGKVYGDYSNPTDLGSGSSQSAGGGAIIISTTGNIAAAGTISSGGVNGNDRGSSGGTVNLSAGGTLSGAGSITANGAGAYYGSGGGGRVKLAGTTIFYNGTLQATGGQYFAPSAAGTVFKKTTAQSYGDLIIDNGANTGATTAHTPITAPLQLDSVAVKNYGKFRLDTNATATSDTLTTTGDINVTAHGEMKLMSDNDGTPAKGAGMTVTAANVSTDATSSINSNAQGFIHDAGYSNGKGLVAATRGGGGAFGGVGGTSNDGGAGGQVYGSTTDVAYVGSGGGAANLGGQGGGLIIMNISGTITNAGTISVNGNAGTTNGGGGSGGGLQITTNNIASTGTISANGGNGATNAGGGGGGRIYIVPSGTHSISPVATASGGTGANAGSDGTVNIFIQVAPAAPTLLTPAPDSGNIPGTNWIATDSGNNWSYRKPITISHTNVTSTLTNFPAKVEISGDTDIGGHAKSDLTDLRFTDSSTVTVLPAERETGTVTGGSASGIFWVQVPSISSAVDTIIYAYYGSSASAQANPSGVWDSNFRSVYHLKEASGTVYDSTSNSDNSSSATLTYGATGAVGNAVTGYYAPTSAYSFTGDFTIDMWYKSSAFGNTYFLVSGGAGWSYNFFNSYLRGYLNSSDRIVANTAPTPNVWQKWTVTRSGTALKIYLNGVADSATGSYSGTVTFSNVGGVGTPYNSLDEVEISNYLRPTEWINFEYYNQKDTAGQLTYGAQAASGSLSATNVSKTPAFTFSTTDSNGDYLRYKLQLATDSAFTLNLSEFVEGSDAGGQTQTSNGLTAVYSGQDSQSSTAYASGTTATLTISGSTPLTNGATYYWRVYAIDPGGSNSWSSSSSTLSFEVLPLGPIDHFALTAYSTSVTAGSALSTGPTMTAYDASNNVKTDYTGQVWFTSSDSQAVLTYNTGSHYTFVGGDNGVKAFNGSDVILKTTGNQTITLKNADGVADVASSNILVSPTTLDHFTIVTSATTATAGNTLPNTVNATAYDAYSNVKTDYTGQVWFTSSDGAATLTYNAGNHYTFTSGGGQDNGTHSFAGSDFVLATAGNQTITLNNGDGKADQTTGDILVSAGGIDHIAITPNSLTLNSGSTGQFTATSFDQFNNLRADTFTWSVAAGGGAIDQSGNFSAGIVGGTFSNTVKASNSGVDGFASATVNAAAIPPASIPSEPGVPASPELITPPVVPTETAPQTSTAKADITLSNFHFYTMLDSGNIELNVSDLSNIEVTNNSNILVEIPADIFSKEVNVITISTGESTYLMNLLTGKNKYQTVIPMPTVKGQFEFRILIIYKDGTIKEIKKNVTVDPQGYVYTKSSSYFGLGSKQEVRIEGAQMTLYKVDSGVSKLVDPTEFKQANPVKTNSSGEYAFYVPNGEYYLAAEKAGYKTIKTDNFKVDNLIVNKNLEMELKVKPWIWLIAAGLAVIAIIFLLIRRRRKMNNIRG